MHNEVQVPEGDLLICSGDISVYGDPFEIREFMGWFEKQPHKYKVLILGNHDRLGQEDPTHFRSMIPSNVIYLENSGTEIEGFKIWGSPYTPEFGFWYFMGKRGEMKEHWNLIPEDTNILVTHGPPHGNLGGQLSGGEDVGDMELFNRIFYLKQLKLHSFGHIHENGGKIYERWGIKFVNAALLDIGYNLRNNPIVVDL